MSLMRRLSEPLRQKPFFGREYVDLVELLSDQRQHERPATFGEVDCRNPYRKKVTLRDVSLFHGLRPKHPDVWHLSPYELVRHWELQLLSYPLSLKSAKDPEHHVKMTDTGMHKLQARQKDDELELQPGVDYVVGPGGGQLLRCPGRGDAL